MPEPVTISTLAIAGLGWVAGKAAGVAGPMAGGIIKGASAQAFPAVVRATKDRIAGLQGAPESQDVARAVRIAQIQALERVIRDFQVARPERFGALFARPGDFFERSLEFCARTIGRSKDRRVTLNVEVAPTLTAAIDGLLAPPTPNGPADQHARAVAALAEDVVLEELSEALDGVRLPDGFEEYFRNGSRSKPGFLDLFAIYVTEQIRENQGFRAVLNSVQLMRIEALAFDAKELSVRIEERFGAALDRVESKLDAGFDRVIALLSVEKGVPPEPLQSILGRLGEEHVPLDQIPERLAAKADELLALREQWAKLAKVNPDLADVQAQALALINTGDLAGARSLLFEARQRIRASRQDHSKEEAALLAREAEIDRLEIRYLQAAEKYHEAVGLVGFDQNTQFGYLLKEAGALQAQGAEFGENDALRVAIAKYREAAALKPRSVDPLGWAMVQSSLAKTLAICGARESGAEQLEDAVKSFRAALEERTRERVPLHWAATQINLGNTLTILGNRDTGTERLEEAVDAYRAALKESTRSRDPLSWAMIQLNMGSALASLGERESSTERLEAAVSAFQLALEEYTQERAPLDWALTQNNMGTALISLGDRESGTERLEAAVQSLQAALKERRRERVPLDWAMTQNNLGNALVALGEREGSTKRINEAVEAYRAALEEYTRERVPLDWATAQNNLGSALLRLGERESGTARLEEAVAAYQAALEERTRERVPLAWAVTQNNLGTALKKIGQREIGTVRLKDAVAAYRFALEERTKERVPLSWAVTQNNLGLALLHIVEREGGTKQLLEAIEAFQAAFREFESGGADYYTDLARANLARASELLARQLNKQREE